MSSHFDDPRYVFLSLETGKRKRCNPTGRLWAQLLQELCL